MSMRHDWDGGDDGSSSQKGTLKGMFKKQKKSKQIELDALRYAVTPYHGSSLLTILLEKATGVQKLPGCMVGSVASCA
jgi:hypothetical protein